MPTKNLPSFCGAAALVLGLAFVTAPAYAGFQWVAPSSDNTTLPAPVIIGSSRPAYTPPSNAPEIISPVIISGDSNPAPSYPDTSSYVPLTSSPSSAPMPLTSTATASPTSVVDGPRGNDLATATITVPASGAPAAAPAAPAASSSAGGDIVQGFASQVPLALALRQLLPVGYNFSIDQDVSIDTLVSYKGGKPWRETLQNMLAAANLVGHERGTSITVSRIGVAATPPAMPAIQPQKTLGSLPASAVYGGNAPMPMSDLPTATVNSPDGWTAPRGDTLRKVLTDWCRRANTELQWQAEYDYPVEASAHFSGSFEDAVRGLLAGFDGARPQPIGELHDSPTAGQNVLVIQARGNSYSN